MKIHRKYKPPITIISVMLYMLMFMDCGTQLSIILGLTGALVWIINDKIQYYD